MQICGNSCFNLLCHKMYFSINTIALRNFIEYGPSCIPELFIEGQRNVPNKNAVLWNAFFMWLSRSWECFLLYYDVRFILHWGCDFIRFERLQCEGQDYFLLVPGWWVSYHVSPSCSWDLTAPVRKQGRIGQLPQSSTTVSSDVGAWSNCDK